ncbi:class I tRNA ligase family protein [Kitasatospora aureofaciens]|uniref:class I tRNA ligase family protein n=1 Tax=Kitasatospora aureofaciens TaxID=1894 RepID=UPI0037CC4F15
MMNVLVTATPPTPNGELHLGHLSGPYLAGDVYRRHQARSGTPVAYLSGIDDHQSYTEARAVRDGHTAEHVADHYGERIERAWADTAIGFDLIGHPRRSSRHAELTREVFSALHERGDIVARTRPLPYCSTCDRWAYEAYVTGACPHCGTASCGNACEVCGLPNDCANLADPHCTICGDPCELRDCERLYLQLEPQRKTLELFWEQVRMGGHLRALCHRIADGGLPEIAVSHPADWGLTVPVPGFTEQRIYVWFEMATGYLAAAEELERLRPGSDTWRGGGRTVQFFGYDNGWFHAVLFPAVMKAYDPEVTLPAAFVSNEFYRLDGLKFSTSRRHAIWLLDALRDVPADHLRLHLCWDRPSATQTSFTWSRFTTFLRDDLLARWYGWLADLGRRRAAAANRPGEPDGAWPPGPLAPSAAGLRERSADTLRRIDAAYSAEEFSPQRALQLLDQLVRDAAELGDHHEHLRGLDGLHAEFVAGVHAELAAAAALATGLYPIAPTMAQQLWSALGLPGAVAEHDWHEAVAVPLAASELAAACPLFDPAAVVQKGE